MRPQNTATDFLLPSLASNVQAAMYGIFSFRHLNPDYLGPVVQIRNGTTGLTRDFFASPSGELRDALTLLGPTQTPEAWLAGAQGFITTWYDQSGRGMHATQPIDTEQPYLNRSSSAAGYSAFFTAASNQFLSYGTTTTFAGSNYTFCVREKRAKIDAAYFLGMNSTTTNAGQFFGYKTTTTVTQAQTGNGYDCSIALQNFTTANLEPVRRWTFTHDNTAVPGKMIFMNGVQVATLNNNSPFLATGHGQPQIGRSTSTATNYEGDIFDVFIFNQSIPVLDPSNATILRLDRFLETAGNPPTLQRLPTSFPITSAYDLIPTNLRPNLVGIFSLRLVNPGYAGALVSLIHNGTGETSDFFGTPTGNVLSNAGGALFDQWVGTSTARVTTWFDQSGNNLHATQATAANQPLLSYIPSTSSYAVVFNGTSTLLNYGTTTTWSGQPYTMMVKERRGSSKINNYLMGTLGNTTNNGLWVGYQSNNTIGHGQHGNDYGTLVTPYRGATEPIRSFAFCSSTTAPGKWLYINGKHRTSRESVALLGNNQPVIGAALISAIRYYAGELYELILLNTALPVATNGPTMLANIANNHLAPPQRSLNPPVTNARRNQIDSRNSHGIPRSLLAQARGIFSTRKINPTYKGPILRLRNDTTSALADVFMNADGIVTRVVPHTLDDGTTSGGTVTTVDGIYKVHTFNESGTFTTASARDVDLLVVAGGGGGGSASTENPGGGGGGGEVVFTSFSLAPGQYIVTVGNGGSGNTNGQDSRFGARYLARGGGAGGNNSPGQAGGSGGGGSKNQAGGATIRYLGFGTAGVASQEGNVGAAGGSGAGGQGSSFATAQGGNGGNGLSYSISGTATVYGSGGGGGRFDTSLPMGVGGTNAGLANRGGGGIGAAPAGLPGGGGSGIVIVRTLRHPGFVGPDAITQWLQGAQATVTAWFDQSPNGLSAVTIRGNPRFVYDPANGIDAAVEGNTGAGISWPTNFLPSTYTLFHSIKYNGANRGRILNSTSAQNWLSGHHGGNTGVAHHGAWITTQVNRFDSNLVVSTDQNTPNLYRANGQSLTAFLGGQNSTTPGGIALNTGNFITFSGTEVSDWLAKDLIAFSRTLTLKEIETVEASIYRRLLGPLDRVALATKNTASLSYSTLLTTNTYAGPVFRLRNNRTAAEQDFFGNFHGNLGTQYLARGRSLPEWLSGDPLSNVRVVTWYDQTTNARHLTGISASLSQESGVSYVQFASNATTTFSPIYTASGQYSFEASFQVSPALPASTTLLLGTPEKSTFSLLSTGALAASERNDAATTVTATSTAALIAAKKLYHTISLANATNQLGYINGVQVLTGARPGGTITSAPVVLGSNVLFTSVRIYPLALAAFEISNTAKTQGL